MRAAGIAQQPYLQRVRRLFHDMIKRQAELLQPLGIDLDLKHFQPLAPDCDIRSEEHMSELQSQSNLVCRLLLEKKKKRKKRPICLSLSLHVAPKRTLTQIDSRHMTDH